MATENTSPPSGAASGGSADKSPADTLQELRELLTAYGKQQTVDPFKRLGRFVAFGVPAMFLAGIGTVLIVVAILRVLQTDTGSTFTGDLTWLPYVITLAIAGLLAGLAAFAITRKKGSKV